MLQPRSTVPSAVGYQAVACLLEMDGEGSGVLTSLKGIYILGQSHESERHALATILPFYTVYTFLNPKLVFR